MAAPFSCDSVVVLPDCVEGGDAILFAKNSDRPAGDCSVLVSTREAFHEPGSLVDLGYGTLAQVARTNATMGVALYWSWGYEQGVNGCGVVGGVQAVATKCHAAAVLEISTNAATTRADRAAALATLPPACLVLRCIACR